MVRETILTASRNTMESSTYISLAQSTQSKRTTHISGKFFNIVVVPCFVGILLLRVVIIIDNRHSNLPSVYLNNIYIRLLEHADLII